MKSRPFMLLLLSVTVNFNARECVDYGKFNCPTLTLPNENRQIATFHAALHAR